MYSERIIANENEEEDCEFYEGLRIPLKKG
jgi:hypothetical protein